VQLGMIGLGRWGPIWSGGDEGGHESVVFDLNPDNVNNSPRRATGGRRWPIFGPKNWRSPGGVGDGPRRNADRKDCHGPGRSHGAATRSSTRQTPISRTTLPESKALKPKGIHYVMSHQRRHLGLRARLRHEIGGPQDVVKPSIRFSRRWPPARRHSPTPGREKAGGTSEEGYLYCGPSGSGPFREMSITHRIRPDAGVAKGFDIFKSAATEYSRRYRYISTSDMPRSGGAAAWSAPCCSTSPRWR